MVLQSVNETEKTGELHLVTPSTMVESIIE